MMTKLFGYTMAVLCAAMMLVACHKSYPGLYGTVYDVDNPNPEVLIDRLPVMLSLTDPLYALATAKRGSGAFGFWEDTANRSHWLNARFGIYAFMASDYDYSTSSSLAVTNEPYCLSDGLKARITNACELVWDGNVQPYYPVEHPDYKYNFFLYYIEDEEDGCVESTDRTATTIVKHVHIDGTQDLISAYARPQMEDVEQLEDYNDDVMYLLNHSGDLVYSGRTAKLHIDPHFRLSHQMAKLSIKATMAADDLEGNTPADPYHRHIELESVGIKVPTRGSFVVARAWNGVQADWNDESRLPDLGVTWDMTSFETVYVPSRASQPYGTSFSEADSRLTPVVAVPPYGQGTVPVGRPLLVPPVSQVGFVINYLYYSDDPTEAVVNGQRIRVESAVTTMSGGSSMKAGYEHELLLKVYGLRRIELYLDGMGIAWKDGGDVPVVGED